MQDQETNTTPDPTASPIRVLQGNIFGTLATIAPEKVKTLERWFDEYGISIAFEGEGFHADVPNKKILVGVGALERMWAAAHAYVILSDFYTRTRRAYPERREQSLQDNPEVHEAMQLLSWAIDWERYLAEPAEFPKPPPWPEGLPVPVQSAEMQADNELFYCGVALQLHHEVSHIICQHGPTKPGEDSIAQEKDADAAAIDWILDGLEESDPRFKKRMHGIALAMIWQTTSLFFCKRPPAFKTHLPAYDRLVNAIERHVTDPLASSWYSLQVYLSVFMSNLNIPGYDLNKVHDTPKDYVIYCLDLLATEMNKRKIFGPPPESPQMSHPQ